MSAAVFARLADTNDLSLSDAAVFYAARGVPVFPLHDVILLDGACSCRRDCKGNKGKHPRTRHGLHEATTDVDHVQQWWQQWPTANIGTVTGGGYSDVLDVDCKDGRPGIASFQAARRAGLTTASWAIASTPTGGLHVHWAASGLHGTTRRKIGLDVRGDGGYVVAPPSQIAGRCYLWQRIEVERYSEPLPWQQMLDLLDPPPLRLLGGSSRGSLGGGDISSLQGWLAGQQEGERNDSLHWAACRAIESGHNPDELVDVARAIGLTTYEINSTIRSARRHATPGRSS